MIMKGNLTATHLPFLSYLGLTQRLEPLLNARPYFGLCELLVLTRPDSDLSYSNLGERGFWRVGNRIQIDGTAGWNVVKSSKLMLNICNANIEPKDRDACLSIP